MTSKIAKQWFRDNPRSTVVFHRRWDELSAPSREVLSTPRIAHVFHQCVKFESPVGMTSELSLVAVLAKVDDAGDLLMSRPGERGEHFITYRAVPA